MNFIYSFRRFKHTIIMTLLHDALTTTVTENVLPKSIAPQAAIESVVRFLLQHLKSFLNTVIVCLGRTSWLWGQTNRISDHLSSICQCPPCTYNNEPTLCCCCVYSTRTISSSLRVGFCFTRTKVLQHHMNMKQVSFWHSVYVWQMFPNTLPYQHCQCFKLSN